MNLLRIGIYGIALEICVTLIALIVVAGCIHIPKNPPKYDFPNIFDEIDQINLG